MSLLSPEHAVLLLSGRVLLRADGRLLEQSAEPGWEGGLATLDQLLLEARAKGAVRVSLSHHFARVLVVEPPPVRLKADEMDGWVRGQLSQAYGAEAESWHRVWQDVPPGRKVPVAVIDASRYAELEQRLAAGDLKLAHASPWLVDAWQRHDRSIGSKSGWLALVEPGRIVVAKVDHGRLAATRTVQADADPVGALADLLAREKLQSATPGGDELWLMAPALHAAWQGLAPAYRVHELMPGQVGWGGLLA